MLRRGNTSPRFDPYGVSRQGVRDEQYDDKGDTVKIMYQVSSMVLDTLRRVLKETSLVKMTSMLDLIRVASKLIIADMITSMFCYTSAEDAERPERTQLADRLIECLSDRASSLGYPELRSVLRPNRKTQP